MEARALDRSEFGQLFSALSGAGYSIVGPRVAEGAIVYDELSSVADLPIGWTDEQEAGTYRLVERGDQALFGYAVGPHSWKKYLFPPKVTLWRAERENGSLKFVEGDPPRRRLAFLGVRACELAALDIQDKVFLGSGAQDPTYGTQRGNAFVIAVNCAVAGGTCFCVSMETGPACEDGYDLVVTEIIDDERHDFLIDAGTEAGEQILGELGGSPATESDAARVDQILAHTASSMGRAMDTEGIYSVLMDNLEHPQWDDVAERCLACTNCTLVCPTCFCSTTEDVANLAGEAAERSRRWDSCFTLDFSGLHQTPVRPSIRSRYRQWLTHKLATWYDQFGSSGCVGCGRCITWCPVGIDLTAEVVALREEVPA
ncbi:MAG: 4Fe-4S dicluster domain-containing protein [Acidimicrobiia bacterium]